MKLETWIALAALGLSAMFAALVLSFYNFLATPRALEQPVDSNGVMIQVISISAAPSLILTGVVFGMTRTYGTRPGGILLIASGIIMIAGMFVATTMVTRIPEEFRVSAIDAILYIFVASGAGTTGIGAFLFATSKRHVQNLDDLR